MNEDGHPDLLWQHDQTRAVNVWIMIGSVREQSRPIASIPDAGWVLQSVGDTNWDARPEVFWQHTTSGTLAAWTIRGLVVSQVGLLTPSANPDSTWRIVGPVAAPYPPGFVIPAEPPPLDKSLVTDGRQRRPGDVAALGVDEGRARRHVEVTPPKGWLAWENSGFDVPIAAGVTDAWVRAPLHRAIALDVSIVGPDDRPATHAQILRARIADHTIAKQLSLDESGHARIEGIPFLRR